MSPVALSQYHSPQYIIFYDDRTWYVGDLHDLNKLKVTGVIAIVQKSPNGWLIIKDEHYYLWKRGCWFPATVDAFWHHMFQPGYKLVLFGEYLTDEDYYWIITKTEQIKDWPQKTGWQIGEERKVPV